MLCYDMRQGRKGKLGLALTALTSGRLMAQFSDATMGQFLDTCTRDVQLRAVIMGQTGDYGIAPSEVPPHAPSICWCEVHAAHPSHGTAGVDAPALRPRRPLLQGRLVPRGRRAAAVRPAGGRGRGQRRSIA